MQNCSFGLIRIESTATCMQSKVKLVGNGQDKCQEKLSFLLGGFHGLLSHAVSSTVVKCHRQRWKNQLFGLFLQITPQWLDND